MKLLTKFFCVFSIVFCSCGKTPKVAFDASKKEAEINEAITFTNKTTDAKTYDWDFGDGSTSQEESPSHTYTTAGSYKVSLSAHSSKKHDGFSSANETMITITEKIRKFTATIGGINVSFSTSSANYSADSYVTRFGSQNQSNAIYTSYIKQSSNQNCIKISKGNLAYSGPTTSFPSNLVYLDFFKNTSYPYTTSSLSTEGIFIEYYDASGNYWTSDGDQSASAFSFSNINYGNNDQVEFTATFNCKLYNSSGVAKELSYGSMKCFMKNSN